LAGAGLADADLTGARLTGGSLRGADLAGSRWVRTAIMGTRGIPDRASATELEAAAIAGLDGPELVVCPSSSRTSVAYSPDGSLIATAAGDGTARVWDTATGHLLVTLVPLPGGSYATLLPDGSYKLDGDPAGRLWWAIKMCRFEPGELDPYVPGIRRLPQTPRSSHPGS